MFAQVGSRTVDEGGNATEAGAFGRTSKGQTSIPRLQPSIVAGTGPVPMQPPVVPPNQGDARSTPGPNDVVDRGASRTGSHAGTSRKHKLRH